ncbi:8230_t:CDS:1, partial [Racocetra persica]
MLRPNAKSHIMSSKICTKTGTFIKSEVNTEKNIENIENIQISKDWKLFGVTRKGLQNYTLHTLEWYKGVGRDIKFIFNT